MRYAAGEIEAGNRVVDVGGSDGAFGRRLPKGVSYATVDVDPAHQADFESLDEVGDASADVVTCFETIEHLTLEAALALVAGIARVLRPGGRLFLSTPNVHHPWSFRNSATHLTPFPYDELGGLLESCGLRVEALYRCHRDSVPKRIVRFLGRPIYWIVGVDYAKSVLVVARREQRSQNGTRNSSETTTDL